MINLGDSYKVIIQNIELRQSQKEIEKKTKAASDYQKALMNIMTDMKKSEILREQHAKHVSILNKITSVTNQAKDLSILLHSVLKSTIELLNFDGGGFYLVNENKKTVEIVAHKNLEKEFIDIIEKANIENELYYSVFIDKKVLIINKYSDIKPEESKKFNIKSLASIPLVSEDKIIGALYVVSSNNSVISEFQKAILYQAGQEIGTAICKLQIKNELEKYSETLEQKVKERTSELSLTAEKLRNEITEKKHTETLIKEKLLFEETISSISAKFATDININKAIDYSLMEIGMLSGACRAYVCFFNSNRENMSITHKWCNSNVDLKIDDLQNLPIDMFPWWTKKLHNKEIIYIHDVSKLEPEASAEKEFLQKQNIKSILVFPVFINKKLNGFVRFDNFTKADKWKDPDMDLLQMISNILGNAFERKIAYDRLSESEEKFRSIYENIQDVYYETSAKEVILEISNSIKDISGYSREKMIGKPMSNFYANHNDRKELLKNLIKYNKVYDYEISFKDRSEKTVPCSITSSVLKDDKGKITKIVGSLRNISERKKLEEELRQSEKMTAIGTLAGGVAHDLNNVLQIIRIYTEMIELNSEHEKDNTDEIFHAVDRGKTLINQILTYSRQSSMEKTSVNITNEIQEIIKLLRSTLPPSIEIIDTFSNDIFLEANPTQLNQIIINLVNNASQSMNNKGSVFIELKEINKPDNIDSQILHWACLKIKDNGAGMDEKTKKRIFEPFFTTKKIGEGIGLGLSTVIGIVKSYGGFIDVESEPGKGSEFAVYLPMED